MSTLFFSHPDCEGHDPGGMHPENPGRLRAIAAQIDNPSFAALERREAELGTVEQIVRVHPEGFVEHVLAMVPESGHRGLDPDTILSSGSGDAALRAIGALGQAVDAVFTGETKNAFCAVRPPGHHAEPNRAMGFCVFNNVAVAAMQARASYGAERIAVVDFDVHHGNGTQAAFWDDPNLFYASTHQFPLYPGTGSEQERGVADNIVNCPLPAGAGSAQFHQAMTDRVLPSLRAFDPDFLIVSAGFDAHADDPLAGLAFQDADYTWVTEALLEVAEDCCDGRLVSALEGGYDHDALGRSCAAHLRAMMAA